MNLASQKVSEIISRFENFFVHPDSVDSRVAKRLFEIVPPEKIRVTDSPAGLLNSQVQDRGQLSPPAFAQSKRNAFVKRYKGSFFKRCPGSGPGLTCCNYFVLNLGQQCDMDCSYCYLQSFINSPLLEIYSNIDDALLELGSLWDKDKPLRLGTGEVIDSLSLDPLTLYSHQLIEFFRDKPKWLLEFKSKSDYVDQFVDLPHAGNVIASWSINPENIVASEEHRTASLKGRLLAAQKCKDKGFRLSFHIDPVIFHQGWEENYDSLVDEITHRFSPRDIPYISLGALRFQKSQKSLMRQRFGFKSNVVAAEVFEGKDGKLRYDARLRTMMFNRIINRFKDNSKDWNVFLCMEQPETWLNTFQSLPKSVPGLTPLFEGRRRTDKNIDALSHQ